MSEDKPLVIWIDDEPNLLDAEMFELEMHGFAVQPFHYPGEALDFFLAHPERVCRARAIIIDVLMPAAGDGRLQSDSGDPVSVLLCGILIDQSFWSAIAPRITLYTRLPGGMAFEKARKFAEDKKLRFAPKTKTSRIAVELMRSGIIGSVNFGG